MNKNPINKALNKVVQLIGGQSALAKKIGVKQPTVFNWLHTRAPAKRVIQIEKIVNGAVTRYELRPDIYPRE